MIEISYLLHIKTTPAIYLCSRENYTLRNIFYTYQDFTVDVSETTATLKINNKYRDFSELLIDRGIQDIECIVTEIKDGAERVLFIGNIDSGNISGSVCTITLRPDSVEQKRIPNVTLSPPLANNLAKPGSRINFGQTTFILGE